MKRFFPILTASFCIIGLGAQVSSGMILPFERYLYVASKDRKQRAGISSPEDMPLIIPNLNAGIIYDVDLFASKNLHDRFVNKIDGRPCTIKYENAHYIISMERVE